MPYKDPERKRQWEREHREHRNAQRRTRRQIASGDSKVQKPSREEKWGSPLGDHFRLRGRSSGFATRGIGRTEKLSGSP